VSRTSAIYLDYNATAPVRPAVVAAVARALETGGNPSSVHAVGRVARNMVEEAREKVAALIGAAPGDVVFTSGGTEANNLCLRALQAKGYKLLVSAVEHPSVMETAMALGGAVIPVDQNGIVTPEALAATLDAQTTKGQPVLVSVMTANNETGVIQPVQALAATAHENGALFHTDAVQAAGKISFDNNDINADLVTLSGHKAGAGAGVGALVITPAVGKLTGIVTGGGQEKSLRPGTENLSGIVGFGVAAELALAEVSDAGQVRHLRDDLEGRISKIASDAVIFGSAADRVSNTCCVAMPGVDSEVQVMAFDLEGIAVSAGAACSSGKVSASPVLLAMGVAQELAASAIRISLGQGTTQSDIDGFVESWSGMYRRLGSRNKELSAA
jgi:cysteine desulfurase